MTPQPATLIVFLTLFAGVTIIGFFAARWRAGDMDLLHEWGLGGRRFGTMVTWFLLGGDLYTAYTFVAVPALVFGAGAPGFFAVPYTILAWPLMFLFFPRLWSVAQKKGLRHRRRFCAGPFWQPLAGVGHRAHRHHRHHALYRIAACRHAGGDRRAGHRVRLAHLRRHRAGCAATGGLYGVGALHLFRRPACARADRGGQGFPDLCDGAGGGGGDPRQTGRIWRGVRRRAAENAAVAAVHTHQLGAGNSPMPR